MSIEALNWAWKQDCPSAPAKLVLLAIADHANGDGYCWPSMKRMGDMAGVSAQQIANHVRTLERLGLVERVNRRRYQGQYRGWTYRLPIGASGSQLPVATNSLGTEPPIADYGSELPEKRQINHGRPAGRARDDLFDVVVEVCAIDPKRLTQSERGRINKALKELREVSATVDQVRAAAKRWPTIYPSARLTPTALSSNWSAITTTTGTVAACRDCGQPLEGHDQELCDLWRGGA